MEDKYVAQIRKSENKNKQLIVVTPSATIQRGSACTLLKPKV